MMGIVDVSVGEQTKESKRLFELIEIDVKQLYSKGSERNFAWSKPGSEITTLQPAMLKGIFESMITLKNKVDLVRLIEKQEFSEGLMVFEYDHASMVARLKLFDIKGNELVLIKLPLEVDGPMKHSLLKHVRHASLTALAHYVRFIP